MYHVISTGTAVFILYLISFALYRFGFYSSSFHRKIWNILMAVAFIMAASAGLFLALQINYKWNIPFIKTILKWHVECGIGFSLTAIIHFIQHFKYFLKPEKNPEQTELKTTYPERSAEKNAVNLFLIGLVSTSVQLLLMREMMNIAGGYELITGTFLGSWLIGSAAGAAVARRSSTSDLQKINIAFGISPAVSLVLLIFLTRMLLNQGETPTFLVSIILTLIVLMPFTFVSGFAFMRILIITRKSNHSHPGRLFAIETAGGVTAGITISIISSGILNTYQTLLLIFTLYIYYTLVSFFFLRQKTITSARVAASIICIILIILNTDDFFRQQFLPFIKVTETIDTPYGNITRGEYGREESIYYNHHLLKWQNDETEREENIHYAMIQREVTENILIISGDINSNLPELLKYPVKKILLVERDPALLKYYTLNPGTRSELLRTENADAFRFIRHTTEEFDIILLILPPPSTLLLNRYYTTDFFSSAKKKLRNKGVFMCSPGTGENYFNKESTVLYSSIYNSLASVFKNVIPIVGNKLYYIASDDDLSTEICTMIEKRGISNVYVSPDFLSDDLLKRRSDETLNMLDKNVRLNSLSVPVACFHFQTYNLSRSVGERIPAFALMILIFLMPVFAVKRKNMVMYTSAGALAGFEIILLLSLQSTAGNMYQSTGLIIASLMTGLAIGAGISNSWLKAFSSITTSLLLLLFYLLIGLIINILLGVKDTFPAISLLMILSLIPSFLTGHLFRSLTESPTDSLTPAAVYSADLAGSALGFILISAIAVPLLGIQATIFLLSALIFTGFLLGTVRNK